MTGSRTLQVTPVGELEIAITRTFDAPRSAVFDALTKPELLRRWFGPRGWSLVVCEVDLKPGGTWHFVVRRGNGTDIGARGVYREIVPSERLSYTQEFDLEDFPGKSIVTTILSEDRGRTTLKQTALYPSEELRDADVGPTEHGATESYERLDEYLASVG